MLLWGGNRGGKGEREERVKERKGGVKGNTFSRKILSTMYMIRYIGHIKHKATPLTERLTLSFSKRK